MIGRMRSIALGRMLRMMRIRRGWRQCDVAARANLSPAAVGRHENGLFLTLRAIERHAAALGARLDLRLIGRGGELARLTDEEHAAIVESTAAWFATAGFETVTEASFSKWGERGRIDLLALHPRTRTVVMVEVKTQLLDLQDLFGGLDVKERLTEGIARERGWMVERQVSVLAVAATAANNRIVRSHPALFGAWPARRRSVASLGLPDRRILWWVRPEAAGRQRGWLAGRQRIRRAGPLGSVSPSP